MSIDIPNKEFLKQVANDARYSEKVNTVLRYTIPLMYRAANMGETSVIIEDSKLKCSADVTGIVKRRLQGQGYTVEDYSGSEVEDTCFGVSEVAVNGIKISWK